jgi:hypothetical protein
MLVSLFRCLCRGQYMFHAYFRPNGQVLFSTWDPQLTCPPASPLPVGGSTSGNGLVLLMLSGLTLSVAGLWLSRRTMGPPALLQPDGQYSDQPQSA